MSRRRKAIFTNISLNVTTLDICVFISEKNKCYFNKSMVSPTVFMRVVSPMAMPVWNDMMRKFLKHCKYVYETYGLHSLQQFLLRMDIPFSEPFLAKLETATFSIEAPIFERQNDFANLEKSYEIFQRAGVSSETFARKKQHVEFFGIEPYDDIMRFYARSLHRVCFGSMSQAYYVFSYSILLKTLKINQQFGTEIDFTTMIAVRFLVYHDLIPRLPDVELWDLVLSMQGIPSQRSMQETLRLTYKLPSGVRDPIASYLRRQWEPYLRLRKESFSSFLKQRYGS